MKIKLALLCALAAFYGKPIEAQGTKAAAPISGECIRLNHDARSLLENSRAMEAERMLSAALAMGD